LRSVTTARFRKSFDRLPAKIKDKAKKVYRIWSTDPHHPAMNFKLIDNEKSIFSIRIGLAYRALGIKEGDTMIWFWIGSHAAYDKMINKT